MTTLRSGVSCASGTSPTLKTASDWPTRSFATKPDAKKWSTDMESSTRNGKDARTNRALDHANAYRCAAISTVKGPKVNRDEFIAKFLDEFAGQLLDALEHRQGAERSLWTRMAYMKLKARLGACYDALKPPPNADPSRNGTAQPGAKNDAKSDSSDRAGNKR